jgi:hypothetical protein
MPHRASIDLGQALDDVGERGVRGSVGEPRRTFRIFFCNDDREALCWVATIVSGSAWRRDLERHLRLGRWRAAASDRQTASEHCDRDATLPAHGGPTIAWSRPFPPAIDPSQRATSLGEERGRRVGALIGKRALAEARVDHDVFLDQHATSWRLENILRLAAAIVSLCETRRASEPEQAAFWIANV